MHDLKLAFVLSALFLACGYGVRSAPAVPLAPVPEYLSPPLAPRLFFDIPTAQAFAEGKGQRLVLKNHAITVELRVDAEQRTRITSLRTEQGRELLAGPSGPFSIASGDGKLVRDGSAFKLSGLHIWLHNSDAEIELQMKVPEPVTWRLRLYRDKPYLEQRFEIPNGWRVEDRALSLTLATSPALKPVMPVNTLKIGFKKGASKAQARNRFEFVEKCEHLVYDAQNHAGLAAFVAGPGGEEQFTVGNAVLSDHATPTLGDNDPLGKMLLFPFDGPVEKGFQALRRYIAEDYACQGDMYAQYAWNQFWLWQGKYPDWGYQDCTAARLLDILPHLQAMGLESFHIDAGWEKGMSGTPRPKPEDWDFDPVRFPEGFAPIQKYLREHSMAYVTHLFTAAINSPDVIRRIVDETDMDKVFLDANANESTLATMRQARTKFPDLEVFCHSMNDARRAGSYWKWGNIHYLSDFNQVYFGEGTWAGAIKDLPPELTKARFIDLFTRTASYQATWVWPYKCIVPPHGGFTFGGMEWYIPEMTMTEVSSLVLTSIAAKHMYEWGDDPRVEKPEAVNFFLDWTACWKTIRPFLQEYQHVLPPPDGIHPDGIAHVKNGQGFIFLFNPGEKEQKVALKDVLWSPELELDPRKPAELTDWNEPLNPRKLKPVDLTAPKGDISIKPRSYRVIGVNVDFDATKVEVNRQRSFMQWPPPSKPEGSK